MADNPKVTVIDRATGETRQADAPSITDDFLSGKIGLQPGATVPVTWDGKIVDIPTERLYDALQDGGTIVGKQEIVKDEAARSPLRAAVEGAGRSLSFGFTDAVSLQAGADRDALQARAATGAAALGEGAGMVGQLLYGAVGAGVEGTGMAARALQVAMKPTMIVDDLGRAMAARAESALTGMGLKEGAAKAIGMGVGGAVEGAVVGGFQGMDEAALGNPELNAEILLHAAAEGAKGGALFGGLGGLLIGGAAERLAAKTASRPVAETAEEFEDLLRTQGVNSSDKSFMDKMGSFFGGLTTRDEEAVSKLNNRRGQRILAEGEAAVQASARDMADTLNEVKAVSKKIDDFSETSRAKLVRDEIPDDAGDAAVAKMSDVVNTLRGHMNKLDMDSELLGLGTGGGKSAGAKLSAAIDDAEARVFKAAGVERETYQNLETGSDSMGAPKFERVLVKRNLEDLAGLYDNGRPVAVAVHDALDNLRTVIGQAVKGKSDDVAARFAESGSVVKDALHSGDVFGDAARIHQLLDDAAVKRADMQDYLSKSFRGKTGEISPESVQSYIRGVINVDADTSLSKLKEFAQSNKELLQTLQATGADVAHMAATQKTLENFSKRVDTLENPLRERVSVYNAARRLGRARQQNMAAASNVMSYGLGGALHAATGMSGVPLALASAGAFTALTDPVRFAVNRARISVAINQRMEKLNGAVNQLVTGGAPNKAAARASRVTAQMTEGKSYAERAEAFRRRIDEVHNAASPMGQQEREDANSDFANSAPNHANALAAKQDLATRMLLAAIPQPIATPGGLGLRPPAYTDSAIRRFARLDQAIQDPQSIIHDAMNGKVSHEARQVLHTLYPQLAMTVQAQLMQQMDSDSFKLSPQRERAIKLLLTPVGSNNMQRMTQLQSVITMPAPQATGSAPQVSPTTDVMSAADSLLKQ